MKKIAIVTCVLMLAGVRAEGQFFQSVDGWLKKQQQKQPYDTTYIYRPQERWRLRTTAQLEGESAMMVAVVPDGDSYGLKLDRRLKYKHTVGVGYRNLIVDAGLSPIGGKYTFGGAMNIMGNRVGVTLEGGLSIGFNGVALTGGETTSNLPDDGFIMMNVGLSAYYAFNGKRFSMPAAMNQAFRQLRSAGSFLATFTTRTYGMMRNPDLTVAIQPEFACTGLIGLGGGYAYNFVPSEHWLVHAGLTETVGFLNSSYAKIEGTAYDFKPEVPAFVTKGTLAVLYYWGKWYAGVYATFDSTIYMGAEDVAYLFSRGTQNANITLGVRF